MSLFFTNEMILSEAEVDIETLISVSDRYEGVGEIELSESSFNEESCTVIAHQEPEGMIYLISESDLERVSEFYGLGMDEEEVAFNLIAESVNVEPEQCCLLLESDASYRKKVFFLSEKIKAEKDSGKKAAYQKKLEDMKHREKVRAFKFNIKKAANKKPTGKKPVDAKKVTKE